MRELLKRLALKIADSEGEMSSQTLGSMLYGLQAMRCDQAEVRQLLWATLGRIERCRGEVNSQAIGNALYGLQGMSSEEEVGLVLVFFLRLTISPAE